MDNATETITFEQLFDVVDLQRMQDEFGEPVGITPQRERLLGKVGSWRYVPFSIDGDIVDVVLLYHALGIAAIAYHRNAVYDESPFLGIVINDAAYLVVELSAG